MSETLRDGRSRFNVLGREKEAITFYQGSLTPGGEASQGQSKRPFGLDKE